MGLSSQEWHSRFRQQAGWTRDLRNYLYRRAGLKDARRVLDVGCGTGVLAAEIAGQGQAEIFGLDLDLRFLRMAMRRTRRPHLSQGDAHSLPFPAGSFDLVYCHFLLLWVDDPDQVVREMVRVTRPGGSVLAVAEPDYGGRIDHPQGLEILGKFQQESLRRQGANPVFGRQLPAVFHRAGLEAIETGVLGGQWKRPPSQQEVEIEWQVIQADLEAARPADTWPELTPQELSRLKTMDQAAWARGERVLFVPTFYAWGRVGKSLSHQ